MAISKEDGMRRLMCIIVVVLVCMSGVADEVVAANVAPEGSKYKVINIIAHEPNFGQIYQQARADLAAAGYEASSGTGYFPVSAAADVEAVRNMLVDDVAVRIVQTHGTSVGSDVWIGLANANNHSASTRALNVSLLEQEHSGDFDAVLDTAGFWQYCIKSSTAGEWPVAGTVAGGITFAAMCNGYAAGYSWGSDTAVTIDGSPTGDEAQN